MRAYVVFPLRAFLGFQNLSSDARWLNKTPHEPLSGNESSLKPVSFIVEYLKVECIGIVLEAEDGATETREFEQPRQRQH